MVVGSFRLRRPEGKRNVTSLIRVSPHSWSDRSRSSLIPSVLPWTETYGPDPRQGVYRDPILCRTLYVPMGTLKPPRSPWYVSVI